MLLLFYCSLCLHGNGQTKIIEDLKKKIAVSVSPESKLQAIFVLCDQGYTLHPDTLMLYAGTAKNIAFDLGDLNGQVKARYYESYALTNKGLIDSSLNIAEQCAATLHAKVKDPLLLCNVINQKGRCYVRKNQYKEAIEMGYKIIELAEGIPDTLMQIKAKTLIGWAYLEMGQNREALTWHLKALHTTADTLMLEKYAILFANLSTNYTSLNKFDSAFYYIKKGIAYARKNENLFALSNSLAIASQLYVRSGQASLSEPLLKEVVAIRKLIGDPFYIASDMSQLGLYYAHYGQPEKGIAICNEGIAIARQYHLDTKLFFLYQSLADNYKAMGNYEKYSAVLENILDLKDTVFEKNTANALAEVQTKFEVEKKENTIIKQRLDIVTKNYWLYGSLIVAVFGILLLLLLFQNYRKKEKQKLELMMAEEKRLATVSVKEATENERKRIAADLHDSLGAYAAAISSNVDNITSSANIEKQRLMYAELKGNSQAIVSQLNDTIWVLSKEVLPLTAISDRLKVFFQRLGNSYPDVQMDVIERIETDHLLPPMQAFHLFKILQEAIINALKHSKCSYITITIESTTGWTISIADNGLGLPTRKKSTTGGNGLMNMQNRSNEAGWQIEWTANSPTGTIVIIGDTTN